MNPWLSIWLQPRQTIREHVDNVSYGKIFLFTALLGFTFSLDHAQSQLLGDKYELAPILISSVITGIVFGFLFWYAISRLSLWMGHLFNGHGTWEEVRGATLWASIPFIAKLGLWLIQLLLFGHENFTEVAPVIESSLLLVILFNLFLLLQILLVIWYVFVFSKAIAEVHGFSAWKGLGVSLISYFILVLTIILISLPFVALIMAS
jgi:hypothetical protein